MYRRGGEEGVCGGCFELSLLHQAARRIMQRLCSTTADQPVEPLLGIYTFYI